MAIKKLAFIKKILKFILIAATIVATVMLLLSALAKFFPPSLSTLVAYCGLLFPYLLIINAITIPIWLFLDYRWALLPVVVILLNVNNFDRHFQLRAQDKPETCANCIKVMSYNARAFNIYHDNYKSLNRKVLNFLEEEKPDIFCVQEYCFDKNNKRGLNITKEILKALGLPDNNRSYKLFLPIESRYGYQYGLAVFSSYRIVNSGIVETEDSSSNKAMFVDIRYNGDTLRIYNIHLASYHMGNEDYETSKAILHNEVGDDPEINEKAKKLHHKISDTFVQRQHQAKCIRMHIDTCETPMIVCGDFNDSPASFSYYKIAHGFKDTFRSSGKGTGKTYRGEAVPAFRIDYILHDRQYNDFGHTICTQVDASDHYPIYSYISIINKK
ncbi:MAG: endonuclease/exonuclease/phosphatase family protein [Bacteroidales bacterium]|nr:endonuclease/exonuclease/phosphatase family protein [Bacteroidales bacterium]